MRLGSRLIIKSFLTAMRSRKRGLTLIEARRLGGSGARERHQRSAFSGLASTIFVGISATLLSISFLGPHCKVLCMILQKHIIIFMMLEQKFLSSTT